MKRIRGSLTIEASLVLTVFLFAIFSLVYFIKIIYIHEQIQYAISQTVEEMSAGAYILDTTGILDLQQETYIKAKSNFSQFENNFNTLSNSYNDVSNAINGLINFKTKTYDTVSIHSGNYNNDSSNVEKQSYLVADELFEQKDKLGTLVESGYTMMNQLINFYKFIAEDSKQIITSIGVVPGMEIINNIGGTKIVESIVDKYIDEEAYENWEIVRGKDGMDYSGSRFMLENDDITIVVRYQIKIPFFAGILKPLDIVQGVKARAYTGDGNYNSTLNKEKKLKQENQEVVYITRNGEKYHVDRNCRYIDVKIEALPYGQVKKSKRICEVCEREEVKLSDSTIVYTTKSSGIFHTDKSCWTIYRDVIAITKEDAIKEGYTPCKLCGED